MEGRSWCSGENNELGEIKKGPWKVEEDEVLLNHVKKYGPRDWSSIRSKGLLQRTGKSCRLRWVNKLRPNLKNGVKFSAEEERIVIDLQAQFGNKWARIATYLPGRTDNDVKNFWSSRQKRLARILHNSTPQSKKPQGDNNNSVKGVPPLHHIPSLQAPKFRSSTDQESPMYKPHSCSSSYMDNFEEIPMLDLMNTSTSFAFDPNLLDLNGSHLQLPFPHTPQFPLPLEDQAFTSRLGDVNFLDIFGNASAPEVEPMKSCQCVVKQETDAVISPDSFIDDFPIDMFDHIEQLPSPSDW